MNRSLFTLCAILALTILTTPIAEARSRSSTSRNYSRNGGSANSAQVNQAAQAYQHAQQSMAAYERATRAARMEALRREHAAAAAREEAERPNRIARNQAASDAALAKKAERETKAGLTPTSGSSNSK